MESEKKLSDQLQKDIWDKREAQRVGLILINPKFFDELASEKDIHWGKLQIRESGALFCGIPMTETLDVEKWDIRDGLEKKLSDQLNDDIWDKEREMNREYSGTIKRVMSILINPETFHELASEKDIWNKTLELRISEGWHYFHEIPLIITNDVEKWEPRG